MSTEVWPLAAFQLPSAALRADLAIATTPVQRDIAWLLHAADMVALPVPGRPTLAQLGLDSPATRRRWLQRLNGADAAWNTPLTERRMQRLGLYHEALWQRILMHAPTTRLVAHNQVLREGNATRGELDLIYRPRDDVTRLTHAELAIKFFLGLPSGPGAFDDAARWIGTGSFDSLAIKCHGLLERQLPAALSPAGKATLETLATGARLDQRIIMPGVLYHPWRQRLPLPMLASATVEQGLWCVAGEWKALAVCLPAATRGECLRKPHWLAPTTDDGLSLAALTASLEAHFATRRTPRHLRLTLPDGRTCRLFLVTDGWPQVIPLPPFPRAPSAR